MIQSKQIELVPINRALRELRQLCVDTNEHTRQSKSVPGSIHSRATTHSPSKRDAATNRAADRRPPPTHPYSPGTRARSPDSFVKTSSTHNTRPSRDARIVSLIASRVTSPRVSARGSLADPRNRVRQYHPSVPPPSSPRAHAPNLSRNLPPPSLPEVRASSPRSSPPSRAVCLRTPILFPSRRRRVILPLVVALVPRSRRDASRPTTQTFLARLRPSSARSRDTARAVDDAVSPPRSVLGASLGGLARAVQFKRGPFDRRGRSDTRARERARARARERTYIDSLSLGHAEREASERENERAREGTRGRVRTQEMPARDDRAPIKTRRGVPRMSTARGDATRDDRRTATRARGCAREVEGTTGTVRGTSRVRRTRTNADERGRIPWFIHSLHSFIRRTHSSPLARRGDAV